MTLRALGTFVFALNVLAAVTGNPARAAPVIVDLTIDDLAAKNKTTVTDQQTKRLENQADKDKDTKDASKSLKSVPKDERGDRIISRASKQPALSSDSGSKPK